MKIYYVLISLAALCSCQAGEQPPDQPNIAPKATLLVNDTGQTPTNRPPFQSLYNLQKPVKTLRLPGRLVEISGLGLSADQASLFAVQDEEGTVFKIDKKDGSVKASFNFGKKGDYEGIEVVGDKVYVVKSTGTIYEISDLGKMRQNVVKYNSFLNKNNDVEGLCYNADGNELLLACKGRPATGKSLHDFRYSKCIYRFDLRRQKLDSLPKYIIRLEDIQNFLQQSKAVKNLDKLLRFFSAEKESLSFNPSGIAIHPKTKDLYIISSAGKVLIILGQAGNIRYVEKLNKQIHQQPEGIAFDKNGRLYICNEGKYGSAVVHQFDML